MNKTFLSIPFFLLTLTAIPGKPQDLTLDEYIAAALENNPGLKAASDEASMADLTVNITRAARFTSISAQASGGLSSELKQGNNYRSGDAGIGAEQLVWQNNRLTASMLQTRFAALATHDTYEGRKQDLILLVKTVYYTCLQEAELYQAALDNVSRANMFLEYARDKYAAGTGRKSDILKAESDLAEAEFDKSSRFNALMRSFNDLTMITGLPAGGSPASRSGWKSDLSAFVTEETDSLIRQAIDRYPELQALQHMGNSQDAKIKEIRASFFPELGVNAGYEISYNPLLQRQSGWYGLMTLRWDLFNGFEKRYRLQSEVIRKESFNHQVEEMRNQLVREVSNRLLSLTEARDQILMTNSLILTTTENLETARAQFRAGTGSMLELTDARITDLAAHQNNIQALTAYRIAQANLERLTGNTSKNK
jgi:outer membrane protein